VLAITSVVARGGVGEAGGDSVGLVVGASNGGPDGGLLLPLVDVGRRLVVPCETVAATVGAASGAVVGGDC